MIEQGDIEIKVTKYEDMAMDDPRRYHHADYYEASIPINLNAWLDKRMDYGSHAIHGHAMLCEKLRKQVAHELYGDMVPLFRELADFALHQSHHQGLFQHFQGIVRKLDAMINLETICPEHP